LFGVESGLVPGGGKLVLGVDQGVVFELLEVSLARGASGFALADVFPASRV